MEFASEMVVKASLLRLKIAEVPATLSPDLRNRPPHLRPWRDGWRHLRFLLLMSPAWLFAVPAATLMAMGLFLLCAPFGASLLGLNPAAFGAYWTILGGALMALGHQGLILWLAAELAGIRAGFRPESALIRRLRPHLTLELILVGAGLTAGAGLVCLAWVFAAWTANHYQPFGHVLPAILGTTLTTIGAQTAFGGFLLAVLGGSASKVLQVQETARAPAPASYTEGRVDLSDAA